MRIINDKPLMNKISKLEKEINELKSMISNLNSSPIVINKSDDKSLRVLKRKLNLAHRAGISTELFYKHSGWLLADNKIDFILLREKYLSVTDHSSFRMQSPLSDGKTISVVLRRLSFQKHLDILCL